MLADHQLFDFILKAIERDPGKRWQSVGDMRRALELWGVKHRKGLRPVALALALVVAVACGLKFGTQAADLATRTPIIKQAIGAKQIEVVAAVYDIRSGKVSLV